MVARGVSASAWIPGLVLALAVSLATPRDVGAAEPDGKTLATYQGLKASTPEPMTRFSRLEVLRVDAPSHEAFLDRRDLQTLVRAALQSAAHTRPSISRRVQVAGYHDQSQVYWGVASVDSKWELTTRFSLAGALEQVEFSPSGVSGLLTLAHQLKTQRQATSVRILPFEQAVTARADRLLEGAKHDFEAQLLGLDQAGGLAAVRAMEGRVLEALDVLGLARHARDFEAAALTEIDRRAAEQVLSAAEQLRIIETTDLFSTLNLGSRVQELHQRLLEHAADQAARDLERTVQQEIGDRLSRDVLWNSFQRELQSYREEPESLVELLAVGEDLQRLEADQPALIPYVDAVAIRMSDLLSAACENDLSRIRQLGDGVFDIPEVFGEVEQLVEWYLSWAAKDLAEAVLEAGDARLRLLAENSFDPFRVELESRDVLRASTRQLRDDLWFFQENAQIIPDADAYIDVVSSTLSRFQSELSAELLDRMGLPSSTKGLGVSVGGHEMDLGTFAENLSESGHRLVAASAQPNESGESTLSTITIETEDALRITIGGGPGGTGDAVFVGSSVEAEGVVEDLFENEWVSLMLQLGAVKPTGDMDESGTTDSDRFASDPFDPERVVEHGVFAEELVHDVALESSLLAIENHPDVPRFYYHAGRTLMAMGETQEAAVFIERAYNDGYAAASFALGSLVLDSAMSTDASKMPKMSDFRKSKRLFSAASDAGYATADSHVEMVSELIAGMTPDFTQGFRKPYLIEAMYTGNMDTLDGAAERSRTNHRYYFSSLRSAVASEHEGFRQSTLNAEINAYAPELHKEAQRTEDRIKARIDDPKNPASMLIMLEESMKLGERALFHTDLWTVDRSYTEGAEWDSMILLMYIGHDDEELYRFFRNVHAYVRRFGQ